MILYKPTQWYNIKITCKIDTHKNDKLGIKELL